MAKKYIVKQTIAYNGGAPKTATFTVSADDDVELEVLLSQLDGQVEVYEQNVALGAPTASPASTSIVSVERITMRLRGSESKYISTFNRPIVLKSTSSISALEEQMKTLFHPFEGSFATSTPDDVKIVTGDIRKL